jgi:lysyl-tRNA synthetase class I
MSRRKKDYVGFFEEERYKKLLKKMGAKWKSNSIYEIDGWLCYPTKGFAMEKRNTRNRVQLDNLEEALNEIKGVMFLFCKKCQKKVEFQQIKQDGKIFFECACGFKHKTNNNKEFLQPIIG